MVEMTEPDAWRREIDVTIETRLCAAGFERFDGISYSFQKQVTQQLSRMRRFFSLSDLF
jgi:hypothetical protein